MSYTYEPKAGVRLVEFKVPGNDKLVSIKEGGSYESETQLLECPSALKETKTAETKSTKTKADEEEGGDS